MKDSKIIENAILIALQRAEEQGQPVAELLEAVASGEELESWFEPAANGMYTLTIAIKA